MENVFVQGLADPKDLDEFLNREEYSQVGILLDLGHTNVILHGGYGINLKDRYDLKSYLHAFSRPICEVHLHDNQGITDDHLAMGLGNIDFQKAFEILDEIGFCGTLTLETLPRPESLWQDIKKERIKMMTGVTFRNG